MKSSKITLFLCAVLATAGGVRGQPNPPASPNPPAQPGAIGLDSLSDDKLLTELASRRLRSLLDRAFEINKTPTDQANGIRTLISLSELSDPKAKLTGRQRRQLLQEITTGIEQALPNIKDGEMLMKQAKVLIAQGVDRQVNTLEYWGANPVTMAELKPLALTVSKIYDKAVIEIKAERDRVADQIKDPNDPRIKKYEQLEQMVTLAEFSHRMSDYNLALALPGNDPNRNQVIKKAVDYLITLDTTDSAVQPVVRNRLAKFALLRDDYEGARKLFDSVIKKETTPLPDISQQYEAQYFRVQTDVLDKKLDEAQKGISALDAWDKASLPKDPAAQKGAEAALAMLQYRIYTARTELAGNEADKKKSNDQAIATLTELRKNRPDLAGIIDEQLMGRLPANPDVTALDTLLLQAMITKADQERVKPEGEAVDKTILERGVSAAREYIKRKGQPGVDAQMMDTAALVYPFFQIKLDRKIEGVNALLDYMATFGKANPEKGRIAMENAASLIADARKTDITDPEAQKAYDRFLPLAIAKPYERKDLAFEYASLLQRTQKFKEAVQYFQLVPPEDKRYLTARFFLMVANKQRLTDDNEKLAGPDRQQVLADIQTLADEVQKAATAGRASATDDKQKLNFQSMLVRTALLAADISFHEQKTPARTLVVLEGFDDSVKGLPNENDLNAEGLLLHVNAHMALGQTADATRALVELLNKRPGGEGATIVFNLLTKLNEELDHARTNNNVPEMKRLARDRAELSGFLVTWAKENKNETVRKQAYTYQRFDASTKHLAADLEEDNAKRKQGLEEALKLFQQLQSPSAVDEYKESVKGREGVDASYPDPVVTMNIAFILFDLDRFAEAQPLLAKLIVDKKLGARYRTELRDGQETQVDNDQYWEAMYKNIRSLMEMAKTDPSKGSDLEGAKSFLKFQYIDLKDGVGGKTWHPQFEQIRKELIPDFDPAKL